MKAISVIFTLIGAVASRSIWQTVNIKNAVSPIEDQWEPYKDTSSKTKMSFSYFTVNHTDGSQYLNGTVTLKFHPNSWAVPLQNDQSNVRMCLTFLDPNANDTEDSLGLPKPMANMYEQILIDIPNFQKRSAESTVIYKQWYQPFNGSFASLYNRKNDKNDNKLRYNGTFYTNTPKGMCGYIPEQGKPNGLKVAENGWEVSDMSFDDEANVLKVDIARPALMTDPEEKFLSHNFTAGNSYQVMMNWMSLPYGCVRGSRECPRRPQGESDGTTGTYGIYRVFGEQNKENTQAEPVGATMKVLMRAKYIKVVTTLALVIVSTYLY